MDEQEPSNPQANPYLSPNQQDLLFAALNSQANITSIPQSNTQKPTMSSVTGLPQFVSPETAEPDSFNADYTPDLDYFDGDNSFDFENADLGGEMIGALPGESGEKRKNPDENDEEEEGDAKRQETQEGEKGAKKPGRKPLTSEPTTKRKAQNRAAQRAFRERKEKHLKDLETKVTELTKASEADKHENGLLKAQVERLQVELREYRKRLTLNSSGTGRSPPQTAANAPARNNSNGGTSYGGNFQFDFPKFGALPGSQIFGNQAFSDSSNSLPNHRGSSTPSNTQSPTSLGGYGQPSPVDRQNSTGRSMSPTSLHNDLSVDSPSQIANLNPAFTSYSTNKNMHGFASTLSAGTSDPLGDLFSPSILKGANSDNYFNTTETPANTAVTNQAFNTDNGGDNSAGLNRVFQFNSGSSVSDSTSPSASSSSQWNANGAGNSSCGTSPEPSHDSPANKDKTRDTFNEPNNQLAALAHTSPPDVSSNANSAFSFGGADYSMPAMNNFDPVLFGDYRESQDAIVGDGEFNNGFFDDALNSAPFDYGSPSNLFGILQSPQQTHATVNNAANAATPSKNLMAEIEKNRDGDDDYGLNPCGKITVTKKEEGTGKLISCNNIWNQLQSNPDFQEGKFDLDNLCSELRTKARCSESGVMVDQDHVDAALRKLGKKEGSIEEAAHLMFEQKSWDKVLSKLGGK